MLAAGHVWRELGLEATLDRLSLRGRSDATRLSDRALVLVANRLTAPGSEFPSSGSVPAWPLSHGSNCFSWKRLRQEMSPAGLL
jgi:hypothetical protein